VGVVGHVAETGETVNLQIACEVSKLWVVCTEVYRKTRRKETTRKT
jgi:hypothetical protein